MTRATAIPAPAAIPAPSVLGPVGRAVGAASLILGPLCFAAAESLTQEGTDDPNRILDTLAGHPGATAASILLSVVSAAFLLWGLFAVAARRLTRGRLLVPVGLALALWAMLANTLLLGVNVVFLAMSDPTLDRGAMINSRQHRPTQPTRARRADRALRPRDRLPGTGHRILASRDRSAVGSGSRRPVRRGGRHRRPVGLSWTRPRRHCHLRRNDDRRIRRDRLVPATPDRPHHPRTHRHQPQGTVQRRSRDGGLSNPAAHRVHHDNGFSYRRLGPERTGTQPARQCISTAAQEACTRQAPG